MLEQLPSDIVRRLFGFFSHKEISVYKQLSKKTEKQSVDINSSFFGMSLIQRIKQIKAGETLLLKDKILIDKELRGAAGLVSIMRHNPDTFKVILDQPHLFKLLSDGQSSQLRLFAIEDDDFCKLLKDKYFNKLPEKIKHTVLRKLEITEKIVVEAHDKHYNT